MFLSLFQSWYYHYCFWIRLMCFFACLFNNLSIDLTIYSVRLLPLSFILLFNSLVFFAQSLICVSAKTEVYPRFYNMLSYFMFIFTFYKFGGIKKGFYRLKKYNACRMVSVNLYMKNWVAFNKHQKWITCHKTIPFAYCHKLI